MQHMPSDPTVTSDMLGLDPRSIASLPANIRASPIRMVKRWPMFLKAAAPALVAVPIAFSKLPASLVILIVPAIAAVYFCIRIQIRRNWFRCGLLIPGRVVALNPTRIAVTTNLSRVGGCPSFMVCRLITFPLEKWAAIPVQIGDRVASTSIYWSYKDDEGDNQAASWATFIVEPVQVGTSDQQQIQEALARLPQQDWLELEAALAQLPIDVPNGTYRVDLSEVIGKPSGWPPDTLGQKNLSCKRVLRSAVEAALHADTDSAPEFSR